MQILPHPLQSTSPAKAGTGVASLSEYEGRKGTRQVKFVEDKEPRKLKNPAAKAGAPISYAGALPPASEANVTYGGNVQWRYPQHRRGVGPKPT